MMSKRSELLQDVIEKLTHVIHNMNTAHNFPFDGCMLSRQQVMILFFIYENKGRALAKDVAKFLHVTPGAVTQFVDDLVNKKIIVREEHPTDRRRINIKFTIGMERKINDFRKNYLISASQSFQGLSDKELGQLVVLLQKVKSPKRI